MPKINNDVATIQQWLNNDGDLSTLLEGYSKDKSIKQLIDEINSLSKNKVDKDGNKVLSEENFTKELLIKLNSIEIDKVLDINSNNLVENKAITKAINDKVGKVEGKGLSTNDFETKYKDMLDNVDSVEIIPGSPNLTTSKAVFSLVTNFVTNLRKEIPTIDEELSEESENPVQNKIVTAKINEHDNIISTFAPIWQKSIKEDELIIVNSEVEGINDVLVYDEEYGQYFNKTVRLKDTKAREKIDKVEGTADQALENSKATGDFVHGLEKNVVALDMKVNELNNDIQNNIKPKLTDLDMDIADLEDRKANVFSINTKGENININDSADSKFNSLKLYGKSKQTQYSGKNLFNNDTSLIKTISYKSSEASSESFRAGYEIELPPGKYTAKAYFKDDPRTDTSEKLYLYGVIVDENNVVAVTHSKLSLLTTNNNGVDVFNTRTFEIQEGQKLKYYDGNNTGNNNNNLNHAKDVLFPILNIQIEKGETATEYEPYVGGKASPSPEYPQEMSSVGEDGSVEVGIRGKNLIPYLYNSNITISGVEVIDNGDGSLTLNGSTASVKYGLVAKASFPKNVPLTLSCKGLLGYKWNELSFQLQNFDASNTKINTTTVTQSDVSKTVTFSDNYSYSNIYICVGGNKEIHTTLFPMVEVGSTATEYEPRKELQSLITSTPNALPGIPVTSGGNYTDANGQQWLCDEYDFTTGKKIKWIETYTYNGTIYSANYYTSDYGSYIMFAIIPPGYEGKKVVNVLSSHFKYNSQEFIPNTIRAYNTGIYISLSPSDIGYVEGDSSNIIKTKSIEYLNSFVSESNPLIIIYSKKDAVIEEIPSDLMNAYSELKTYKPISNIYTLEGAGIEVDYVADTKAYIDNKFIELQQAIISMGGNV